MAYLNLWKNGGTCNYAGLLLASIELVLFLPSNSAIYNPCPCLLIVLTPPSVKFASNIFEVVLVSHIKNEYLWKINFVHDQQASGVSIFVSIQL